MQTATSKTFRTIHGQAVELTIERVQKETLAGRRGLYLVKVDSGRVIGLLERHKNTRTEIHPWIAFSGVGPTVQHIGAFYNEGDAPIEGPSHGGGRPAAIDAIVAASCFCDACSTVDRPLATTCSR